MILLTTGSSTYVCKDRVEINCRVNRGRGGFSSFVKGIHLFDEIVNHSPDTVPLPRRCPPKGRED